MSRWSSSSRNSWGSWQGSWDGSEQWTKDKSYRDDGGYGRGSGGRGSRWRGRGQQLDDSLNGKQTTNATAASSSTSRPPSNAQDLAKLKMSFCPDPGRGGFTATYDAAPTASVCGSVNAGSGRSLKVGGSGLNGQFAKDLSRAGQPVDEFQYVHSAMMRLACTDPGKLHEASPEILRRHEGLVGCFTRVASSDGRGFVAVDVLLDSLRPFHPSNAVMVYCVGPDRREYPEDDSFLQELSVLGESLSCTCDLYNQVAGLAREAKLPVLQRVRVGLVSGGKYAGRVPKPLVASSLLEGLARGALIEAQAEGSGVEFEFAYDEGVFEKAWQSLSSAVATATVESTVSDIVSEQ